MRHLSLVLAGLLLIINVGAGRRHAAATDATPAAINLPVVEAPFGLGAVALPTDRSAVEALFDRLPPEVNRQSRTATPDPSRDRVVASYGEPDWIFGPPLTLQALDLRAGDFFPSDFTAGQYVARARATTDQGVTSTGRDGDLVWVRAGTTWTVASDDPATPEIGRPAYTLAWGHVDSSWLFTAAADTPEGLEALVSAFVATAMGTLSTPAPPGTPTS